jgi:O-antigen/teichoic acid export membrane protein
MSQFGVWVALGLLASWLGRFDLGIWTALPREVADRRARGDLEGLRTLSATWLFYDLSLGIAIVAAAVFAAPYLLGAFAIDPGIVTAPVWGVVAVQAVVQPILRHFMYTLNGLQRLDRVNQVSMAAAPVWGVGIVIFVEQGLGLLGLAINNLLFALLQAGAVAVLLRSEGYPLSLSPASFRSRDLRALVSFGWKMEAGDLLTTLLRSDRLLLGPLGYPSSTVALYQFGSAVPDRLASGVIHLSSSILPAVADLSVRGDTERIRSLFLRSTKYHALAGAGLLGFAVLFAHELLMLWLKRPLPESVEVLRIMAVGAFAATVVSPAMAVAAALGRAGLRTLCVLASLAGALLLYMAGARRYDVAGLALAVSGGTVLAQVLFMIGFRRLVEFRWREYVGNALLKPLAAGVPPVAVFVGWRLAASHLPPVDGRLSALAVLAPALALTVLLSWLLARAAGSLDAYDVDVLKSLGRRSSA